MDREMGHTGLISQLAGNYCGKERPGSRSPGSPRFLQWCRGSQDTPLPRPQGLLLWSWFHRHVTLVTSLWRVPPQLPYLELEEIVLHLLLVQVQLDGHQLLQSGSHIPSHAHISTNVEVALLPVEHAEYLIGQLLLQDVLNVDLKAEDTVGPALDADVTVVRHIGRGEGKRAIEGFSQDLSSGYTSILFSWLMELP